MTTEKKIVNDTTVNCSLRVSVYNMIARCADAELQLSTKRLIPGREFVAEMLTAKDNAEFVMEDYADQIDEEGKKAIADYEAALPKVNEVQKMLEDVEADVRERLAEYADECMEDAKQILAEADHALSTKNYDFAMQKTVDAAYTISQIRRGYKDLDVDIHDTDTEFQYWLTNIADRTDKLGCDILGTFYHDKKAEREAEGFIGKARERMNPIHRGEEYDALENHTLRIHEYLMGCRPYRA